MFDNLRTYLGMYASPEQATVLLHACQVLADAGYTEHASVLEQDLLIADQMSQDQYLGMVQAYMVPLYRVQLQEFGVVPAEQAQLPILTSTLEAIGRLDNWDDPGAIDDALSGPYGPEACLADALGVVGADESDVYLEALQSVSEDLVTRTREILAHQLSDDVEVEDGDVLAQHARLVRRVNAFSTVIAPENRTLLRDYLEGQGRLNESVRNTVFSYYDRLHAIAQTPRCALELLALLSATQTPDTQLHPTTMRLLEELGVSTDALVETAMQLTALIKKVPVYENA
jgi:hypothetical protein